MPGFREEALQSPTGPQDNWEWYGEIKLDDKRRKKLIKLYQIREEPCSHCMGQRKISKIASAHSNLRKEKDDIAPLVTDRSGVNFGINNTIRKQLGGQDVLMWGTFCQSFSFLTLSLMDQALEQLFIDSG